MPTVVGIRLRFSKTLWFDPAGSEPVEGDIVIVETERGTELGTVVQAPHDVESDDLPAALKPVVRVADEADLARVAELEEKEREAMPVFRQLVVDHKLDMKPVDVEYLFDGDKIVFYFSAEERVDFRELVKELASRFRARIDMRQVGVRDEARMVGGIGHCGEMLCCTRLGGEFQPVSIRMAKEQDLPLNPLKISGLCGRLMCCLRYEFDAYKDYKSRAPKRGAIIETPAGLGKVSDLNTPRETVSMRLEDGTSITVPLASMCCAKGTGCPCSVSQEALDEAMGPAAIPMAMPEPLRESVVAEEPQAPREGNRRRRRRRGGAGEGEQPAADAPAAEKPSEPQKKVARRRRGGGDKPSAEKPAAEKASGEKPAGEQPSAEASGDKPARSGRRRRRRRSGGGGTKAE